MSVQTGRLVPPRSYTAHARVLDVVCSGFYDSIGLYTMCTAEEIALAKVGPGKQDILANACHKHPSKLTASAGLSRPRRTYIQHS
jgi:hypothetical protein